MYKFWHICNGRDLAKIQSEGLVARLGARSIRFGKSAQSIHVCDSPDTATNLSRIPLWATNPENKEFGQMLIEIETSETGKPDPFFAGGIILTQNIPADRIRFLERLTKPQIPEVSERAPNLVAWTMELASHFLNLLPKSILLKGKSHKGSQIFSTRILPIKRDKIGI